MTNKIEIWHTSLQGNSYYTMLSNDTRIKGIKLTPDSRLVCTFVLDQLDLRTEKDLLNDLYAKLGEWFSMANILLPNNHPYYHYVSDLLKQISEIKP